MRIFITLLSVLAVNMLTAQTNVSAGLVYGTWKKSGSPYKINGQISVPKDSTLRIEAGVKVEFQGAYMLHVYGSIQALGKVGDSVWFTPVNKTTGWQGIHVHRNKTGADSNLFLWSKFEYVNKANISGSIGTVRFDTVSNAFISNCLYYQNKCNYAGAIMILNSNLKILNCTFQGNMATSNLTSVTSAGGSAISSANSTIKIYNCIFNKNICRLPNYSNDTILAASIGCINSSNDKLEISDSYFSNNKATGTSCLSIVANNQSTLILDDVIFENNYSSRKSVFDFANVSSATVKLNKLTFKNNKTGYFYGPGYAAVTTMSTAILTSKVKISNSQFITEAGYECILAKSLSMNNCKIFGSDSIAIKLIKVAGSEIVNSLFTNNGLGIDIDDGAQVNIVNSTIANNGYRTGNSSVFQGGVFMHSSGNSSAYSIYNSIIQNNYNKNGMANILGGKGGTTCQALKNSIIQGGTDSAKLLFITGNMIFNNKSDVINDTVIFVNPPIGIGPLFYDSTSDLHIKNTCNYSYSGINMGLNAFTDVYSGLSINLANTTDLDGNPRIRCGTVDIGPYELEGSKQAVSIENEPTDQSICPKSTVTTVATTCGAGLSYQWQKSSNGSNFSNITGADSLLYRFVPQDSGYYRLIITQTECNKKDTSRVAKIAFKPGSNMNLSANLKDSTVCSQQPIALQATIVNANSYQWQESNDGSTFGNLAGATTNPFIVNAANSKWYRLIAKNTLCNYFDTFPAAKITANPLPTPNLGADVSIPNTGNKILNPGTFTAYNWSTGATSPTLTVNNSNLTVGVNNISVQVTGTNGCKASDTIVVTLEPVNGLQNRATAGIKVYPVPATDLLNFDIPKNIENGSFTLRNLEGKVLHSGNLQQVNSLNISMLPLGNYLLTIDLNGESYTIKVVK